MTDCAHNDKSKYVDCATELLAARKEVMRLRTENATLRTLTVGGSSRTQLTDELRAVLENTNHPYHQRVIARAIRELELLPIPAFLRKESEPEQQELSIGATRAKLKP